MNANPCAVSCTDTRLCSACTGCSRKPAWLFEVVDSSIPTDWICSTFDGEPSVVLGPEFIARSLDAYSSMVELEPDQVEKFWKRLQPAR